MLYHSILCYIEIPCEQPYPQYHENKTMLRPISLMHISHHYTCFGHIGLKVVWCGVGGARGGSDIWCYITLCYITLYHTSILHYITYIILYQYITLSYHVTSRYIIIYGSLLYRALGGRDERLRAPDRVAVDVGCACHYYSTVLDCR